MLSGTLGTCPALILTDGLGRCLIPPQVSVIFTETILRHPDRRAGNFQVAKGRPTFTRVDPTPIVFPAKAK